jgi:benzodiazapine receptor
MKNPFKLIISIAICLLAGAVGSIFTVSSVNSWYLTLVKPSFNPPSWLFAPVWTILYIMMGISLYLVWKKGTKAKEAKKGMRLFFTQLWLNLFWSLLFFGIRNPLVALIEIIILWIMILMTMIIFYKLEKKTVYLLIPYLLWVTFATILNFAIVLLN